MEYQSHSLHLFVSHFVCSMNSFVLSRSAICLSFSSLQLQDYSKAPFGETEVKFQLTRETFEAMLKSMTYINEQLSR